MLRVNACRRALARRKLDDFQDCWYHRTREGCAFPHSGQEILGERVSARSATKGGDSLLGVNHNKRFPAEQNSLL